MERPKREDYAGNLFHGVMYYAAVEKYATHLESVIEEMKEVKVEQFHDVKDCPPLDHNSDVMMSGECGVCGSNQSV